MFTLAGGAATAWGQLDPNDPWPKYCHDERNTCYTPYRGPHCKPQLRWGAPVDTPQSDTYHLRGAAVAKFGPNNVRHVLVGTRDPDVLVFRFHPADGEYDPEQEAAQPVKKFSDNLEVELGGVVNSTPLVLADDTVVVQTNETLERWDLHLFEENEPPERLWSMDRESWSSSPTCGPMYWYREGANPSYIYAFGDGGTLYCINPEQAGQTAVPEWPAAVATVDAGYSTPAIGPIADDDEYRNFVYVSVWTVSEDDHFFAIFADGNPGQAQEWAWADGINDFQEYGDIQKGTFGSPSVHLPTALEMADQPVVCSDDGGVYAFDNLSAGSQGSQHRRWRHDFGHCISSTAGLAINGDLIFWNEWRWLRDPSDEGGSYSENGRSQPGFGGDWYFGAPVVDSADRFYVATPGTSPAALGRKVLAYTRPLIWWENPNETEDPNLPLWIWGDEGDLPTWAEALPFSAPLAMDEDGTVYCVSHGYIFALRPLVGDFNGDQVSNCDDADALVLALVNRESWEQQYGTVYGINLLGVGDANNDGAFNNFDITALRRIWDWDNCDRQDDWGEWEYYDQLMDLLLEQAQEEEGSR
jgi:hypothetical protein